MRWRGVRHAGDRADLKVAGKTGTAEFGPRHPDGSTTHTRGSRLRAGGRPAARGDSVPAQRRGRDERGALGSAILDYSSTGSGRRRAARRRPRVRGSRRCRREPSQHADAEFDFVLLLAAVALTVYGALLIYSGSLTTYGSPGQALTHPVSRQIAFGLWDWSRCWRWRAWTIGRSGR